MKKMELEDIQDALEEYMKDHPDIDMIKIEAGRKGSDFELLGIYGPGVYIDTTISDPIKK